MAIAVCRKAALTHGPTSNGNDHNDDDDADDCGDDHDLNDENF